MSNEFLDRIIKATEAASDVVTQANQVNKDLRQATKEAREVLTALERIVEEKFDELAGKRIEAKLETTFKEVLDFQHTTYKKIITEFDKLSGPLLASLDDIREHARDKHGIPVGTPLTTVRQNIGLPPTANLPTRDRKTPSR